ncbi:uncharacterized protein LOC113231416 [Hyposmocoma kahamanoa]|uniref:uncharacterized protein LOC113231416 n=1 Tax=Hyposmocoma kahamanoa TaxID=1477025 RepID=UPI000E6DA326|nr:uncharacterized protein LOC113231416 [Hyposmocoma kahamanoa]
MASKMIHFLSVKWKVSASVIWILITLSSSGDSSSSGESSRFQGEAFDSKISNYLKEYIKPYLQTKSGNPIFKSAVQELGGKLNILEFIDDKIKSLEPLLDGGLPSEEPETELNGEETTIIEFADKPAQVNGMLRSEDSFKDHIEKYKKLRFNISKALSKEPVSNKTKMLVTSTLDSMLTQMIEHQCKWTNGPLVNRANPAHIMDSWARMWNNVQVQYKKLMPEEQQYDEKQQFLKNLHEFFTNLYDDVKYLSQNYKVVCEFVQPNQQSRIPFFGFGTHVENMLPRVDAKTAIEKQLQSNKLDDKATCQNFRVCYDEIKVFMVDLYKNLNDTGVSTVSNYAAMYQRDVSEDSHNEKEKVIDGLNKMSKIYEHKIDKLFRKQLTKFNLDPQRSRYANIKFINKLISSSIDSAKTRGKQMLDKHLKFLRPKLVLNILKDLFVNIDMDLGNLERDLSEKLCTMFVTCNGKYVLSRKSGSMANNKGVYVKVQLTLNDDEKTQVARKIMAVNAIKTSTNLRRYDGVTKSLPYRDITRTMPQIQRLISEEPEKVNGIESNSNIENSKLPTSPTTFLVIYKK